MNSQDYGEPVSPVRRAWENGGRQYYEERRRQEERQTSMIDYAGQMDVCTPVRRHYATSNGYSLREQEYLVRSGQMDGGLQPPAGWREPHANVRPQPAARPVKFGAYLEEWQPPAAAPERAIVYAQYDPAFDPDLHPQPPVRAPKPKVARPVEARQPAPVPQPVPAEDPDAGERPPGMTPAEWLAQRHVVSVARKAVADPASVSYVPVQEEEPQLVVTPGGFRYAERFSWLEIKR